MTVQHCENWNDGALWSALEHAAVWTYRQITRTPLSLYIRVWTK